MQTAHSAGEPFIATVFGSEHDGGFAQFTLAHTDETHAVNCGWSDVELASIPCAYSTAENMLHRIELGAEHVLLLDSDLRPRAELLLRALQLLVVDHGHGVAREVARLRAKSNRVIRDSYY